jgi:hypothetical protein
LSLTQQLHVPPPSLQGKTSAVGPGIERVAMKALSKEPGQRFATVNAFADALAQASLDTTGDTKPLNE